jgi:hydrogenase nickel incorporation protein HypB
MKRVGAKQKVLKENDRIAMKLRTRFEEQGVLALNLISSPGAGKTSLLERTLPQLPPDVHAAVLTGDIETDNDAQRLAPFGSPVRQISTGGTCHLNAQMVERGLAELRTENFNVLFIENIGNLVCPAGFDLGEAAKIVVLSVTEGDDKPLKYPTIFIKSDLLVLNKIDLLPHVPFDVSQVRDCASRVHPGIEILELSCTTGEGIEGWLEWLATRRQALRSPARHDRTGSQA